MKIFADGIPPLGSAWTRHRYHDGGNGGLLVDGRDPAERAANLHAMITRAMAAGAQVGVHATGDLSIDAAIDAFAAGPRWKGTLAPGMAADLCVLDGDPLHTRLAEVPGLRVQATIAGGRLTHDKMDRPNGPGTCGRPRSPPGWLT